MDDRQRDDYRQFLDLIEAHQGIIYKITNSFCATAMERQDLTQDIILKLYQCHDRFIPQAKISTWLYRVALNTAISYYRKEKSRKKNRQTFEKEKGVSDLEQSYDSDRSNLMEEKSRYLRQFLSELKELDRALMFLYLERRPQKEIAEIMGISASNVATKIARIKVALRARFSKINL